MTRRYTNSRLPLPLALPITPKLRYTTMLGFQQTAASVQLLVIIQASLHATTSICMPPPDKQQTDGRKLMAFPHRKKCIWPRYLDL